MESKPIKVTAIIPSLASVDRHYLKRCVESLRATTDWDIIVVTNGGTDANPLHDVDIQGISKRLHTKQQGQCNAVNIGANVAEANTDYFFISNADMYYASGWNQHLRFDDLCFSPNLVEAETKPDGSAPPFLKFDGGYTLDEFKQTDVDHFIGNELANFTGDREEPGFNFPLFIDANLWRTIGGYDVKYDPWGSNSDTDLQTAVNLAGLTPKRYRDILVYHFSNKSGTFDGTHQDAWQHNWDYFNQKWGFNRDTLGSDVWYNKDMLPVKANGEVDYNAINFDPEWVDEYYSE
jgi:GT2 family glycosyltransferase